jgi:RNA polymerase sigma-70 factor (ECF subfamily)
VIAMVRLAGTPSPSTIGQLVEIHADFVWRSLRRLGVPDGSADDATQQVFLVAQAKLGHIQTGRERAFLFSVALNVAAHVRRSGARRREVSEAHALELADPRPLPDAELDARRARALLDEVLDALSVELRTVFVLFELEEMSMAEISDVLEIPPGTVASRLRRAREEFHKVAERVRARVERRPTCPSIGASIHLGRPALAAGPSEEGE